MRLSLAARCLHSKLGAPATNLAAAVASHSKPPSQHRSTAEISCSSRKYTTYSQLPSEHQMVYEMCRKFAEEELMPNAGKWDQKHEFPTDAVDKLVSGLSFSSLRLRFLCLFFLTIDVGDVILYLTKLG
jgi:hypothetical protein